MGDGVGVEVGVAVGGTGVGVGGTGVGDGRAVGVAVWGSGLGVGGEVGLAAGATGVGVAVARGASVDLAWSAGPSGVGELSGGAMSEQDVRAGTARMAISRVDSRTARRHAAAA